MRNTKQNLDTYLFNIQTYSCKLKVPFQKSQHLTSEQQNNKVEKVHLYQNIHQTGESTYSLIAFEAANKTKRQKYLQTGLNQK